jgi:isopentenyl-diphosphate delta-isomerase
MDYVILVNERDEPIGVAEKLAAHADGGLLHRAFSIFVFDSQDRLLLQRRASAKYHFAGAWSNTCCGHPRPDEDVVAAGERRLREEFGIAVAIRPNAQRVYTAHDPASGLTEREYLHILTGRFDGTPLPDPDEIESYRWVSVPDVRNELTARSQDFSPWFPIALDAIDLSVV